MRSRFTPFQDAGTERLRIVARELVMPEKNEKKVVVKIVVGKTNKDPILSSTTQQVEMRDADSRRIEYRDKNPSRIEFESMLSGIATYVWAYGLVDASNFERLETVTFTYLDKPYIFQFGKDTLVS